ncbi:hypothetical protein B0T17DRAFT_612801 [Bombardia bombarda]|uniref:Uncharacterized protein n=1 Tax=Bombardia bombarda TaxID=252184 RepID=A0AA40CFW8_9PEZI|nr:hypothetical protein B0T17DRAFT_612801 [Bombardia bombarda]
MATAKKIPAVAARKVNKLNCKKYDRIDRLFCSSLDEKTTMSLDINNELFPCAVGD